MADKGVNDFTGKIDVNYWKKQVKNAKNQQSAVDVITKLMGVTNNGMLGVSNGDQRAVIDVIKYYETLYNEGDLSAVYNTWDPSKNHINESELKKAIKTWTDSANNKSMYFSNGYQPNRVDGQKLTKTGTVVGNTAMLNSRNLAGKIMNNQQIWKTDNGDLYVWVGNEGKATVGGLSGLDSYGYYQKVGEKGRLYSNATSVDYTKFATEYANDYSNTGLSTNNIFDKGGYGNNNTTGGGTSDSNFDAIIKELYQIKDDLSKETTKTETPAVVEKPRVWTNAEAAAHLGLDYDLAKTLSEYNDATNTYYDEALDLQNNLRNRYINNVGITATQAAEDYLDSYKNVAQTAANKGALATNLLSMQLNNAYDMAQGDQAYVQTQRALEQARQAELANNKQLANEVYNKQGTWLSSWIANKNSADVTAYKDAMDAYSSIYASNRKAIASQAADVATKYSGLINAAATNANTQSNSLANLYSFYNAVYPNKKQAANSFWYDMTGGL